MNTIYQKNIEVLRKKNNNLVNTINNLKESDYKDNFRVFKKNNIVSLKVIKNDGTEKLVHSKYRPRKQANQAINFLNFKNYNLIGVAGIGCGYYVEEILNKINANSRLVLFENRLDIMKEVLKKRDLTDVFGKRQVYIFDGTDKNYNNKLKDIFRRVDFFSLTSSNILFFKTPILKKLEKESYNKFKETYFSTIRFVSSTLGNSSEDSLIGVKNILENYKYVLKSVDLGKINSFSKKPVICVAAGPSLDKNIDLLKKHQENAVIIACDTVLEKLLKNNIEPDIVGVLERGEKVYDYFFKDLIKEKKISSDIVLIADGVVHPKIFNEFPGEKLVVFRETIPTERWFANNTENTTAMDLGNSVANLNFSIASKLGFSPIILMGQDLAYSPDGKAHTIETGYDNFGDDHLNNTKKDIVEVTGYNGEKLKSKPWWKIFKKWFELEISKNNIECIDATEGGAYIEGTKIMKFQEVANEYFINGKNSFFKEMKSKESNSLFEKDLNNLILSLEKLMEEISLINEKNINLQKEVNNALEYINKKKKVDKKVESLYRNNENEINNLYTKEMFSFFIIQPILLNFHRQKIKIANSELLLIEKYQKLFNNNLTKLTQMEKTTEKLISILDEGLTEMRKLKEGDENQL